jgi:multiple sugar transport system permease protein
MSTTPQHHTAPLEELEEATPRWVGLAWRALAFAVALVLLFFVLLPMGWMILTAFRTKGTAFRLDFIPNTHLVAPVLDQAALPIMQLADGKPYLHLEQLAPSATTVAAAWRSGSGQPETKIKVHRAFGGLWIADAPLPSVAPVEIRVVVNNESAAANWLPAQPRLTLTPSPADQLFITQHTDGQGEIQITASPGRRLELQLFSGAEATQPKTIPLREAEPGRYNGKFSAPASSSAFFRIAETRSFGAALGELYTIDNFRTLFNAADFHFGRYFLNSFVVASLAAIITVFICTLAGYAFAQKPFHGREIIFQSLLASMLIPGMIFMVPQFSLVLKFGWMNSYHGMIVPHLANVFGLFLLRQYIMQIPRDLFAAAEIDGAREHQVFHYIVIPVCLPIMVTLFLLVFVGQWSNFLWQLIVNTGDSPFITLPVGLQQFKGQNSNDWERIMAGACFSILPIAVLFLTLQRYFLEGLRSGAMKE